MPINVYVPTIFRRLTSGQSRVQAEGSTLAQLLESLEQKFPGIKELLCDEHGQLYQHINVFINNQEIPYQDGETTRLEDGDEVALIPAIAGGSFPFTEEQIRRYSRHIIIPQVGGKGQKKLLQSKVLIIGSGGLGSPAAIYLAAAGVGKLGIVDFDEVDLSNLQRQILHHHHDVGRPKVDSASETITSINPDVEVIPYRVRLCSQNALDIIAGYDVVLDASDNFPTRYLINDACVLLGKPNVHGSIFIFEGQATVFLPQKGCYRCLFPTPPPPGMVPSCQEAGVLGVVPGVIGIIQAVETIKLLLGIGQSLVGRLLLFDALNLEFRQVKLRRNPACPVCGEAPTVRELIDYEEFCGSSPTEP